MEVNACLRREALKMGQPVVVGDLVHVSRRAHISSFDEPSVLAVHSKRPRRRSGFCGRWGT